MNSDGSGRKQLTDTPLGINDTRPAWSPDGTQIAYVRTTDNNSDIWKMNADGNGHDLVETNPKLDINPD